MDTSTLNPPTLRLEVSALSDIGCVRANNQDAFGFNEDLGLYIVCDGMGGSASGEVASAQAVAVALAEFADSADSGLPVGTRLLRAIVAANMAVWTDGQLPQHKGMGTTLVAAALDGETLIVGNVGDSRAYLLEAGECRQLTVDHSYLNELLRTGVLSPEDARTADLKGLESVITRAVGVLPTIEADLYPVTLAPGALVLLTSDGLIRHLLEEEIAKIMTEVPFHVVPAALIALAKTRGGHDNITCVVLRAS